MEFKYQLNTRRFLLLMGKRSRMNFLTGIRHSITIVFSFPVGTFHCQTCRNASMRLKTFSQVHVKPYFYTSTATGYGKLACYSYIWSSCATSRVSIICMGGCFGSTAAAPSSDVKCSSEYTGSDDKYYFYRSACNGSTINGE